MKTLNPHNRFFPADILNFLLICAEVKWRVTNSYSYIVISRYSHYVRNFFKSIPIFCPNIFQSFLTILQQFFCDFEAKKSKQFWRYAKTDITIVLVVKKNMQNPGIVCSPNVYIIQMTAKISRKSEKNRQKKCGGWHARYA